MTDWHHIMQFIDNLLNRITMYRLVLYVLFALIFQAAIFGAFKIVRFSAWEILLSALVLLIVCWVANELIAKIFKAQANVESVYITAMILALIINPPNSTHDYIFLAWAGVLAMTSKFILAIGKKHIFNPAAIAVVITSLALGSSASWWVGTAYMLPLVAIGGLLVVRKVQSWDMVFAFVSTALVVTCTFAFFGGSDVLFFLKQAALDSPLFFFAFIMLTEPLTAPPTKSLQVWNGILAGFLFAPQVHIFSLYFTPEMALCTANIFAYIVSPKEKLLLTLKEKIKLSPDIYDFIFSPDRIMKFKPGQYLEWTLGHKSPDTRGNRRYFTIASSPSEKEIIMGVKFYDPSSSFKKAMLSMNAGDKIIAGQLAGDFTLPKKTSEKLVFIAGGIGITPFRSMVKYLIDQNEKRDIAIFFANKSANDIVYKQIFDDAENKLGIKTFYETGRVNTDIIKAKVPDFMERKFYISGPRAMTESFKKTLGKLGIKESNIKTDFFPGFA